MKKTETVYNLITMSKIRFENIFALPCLLMLAFVSLTSLAKGEKQPTAEELVQEIGVSEFNVVTPGQEFLIGVKFTIKDRWHIYWSNPGESGIPTDIQWQSSLKGTSFSPLIYPVPSWFIYGGIVGFGYEKETLIMTRVKIPDTVKPGQTIDFSAKTEWLVCEETCIPGGGPLLLSVKVGQKAIPSKESPLFEKYSPKILPGALLNKLIRTPAGTYEALISLPLDLEDNKGTFEKIKFFPFTEKNGPQNAQLTLKEDADLSPVMVISIPINSDQKTGTLDLKGILKVDIQQDNKKIVSYAYNIDFPLSFAQALAGGSNLPALDDETITGSAYILQIALMFLLAFAGGIILNIMPCVLPVISLKIMGFVQHAHSSRAETFKLGLWFALGILLSMWVLTAVTLGLQFAGNQIGWGFQFQSPAYIFAMITLCVLITLNLFGVFEVLFLPGASTMQLAQKSGISGAFFNGVLAVILATPCTAPFMGAALGFAFAQPSWMIVLIFTAIGMGLAFPYVLLSAFPVLLKFLPKPGAWMNTAKEFLGFPMLATAIWLIWVFNAQQGRDATTLVLFFLLVLAFGFWIYGKYQATGKRAGLLIALVISLIGFFTLVLPALKDPLPDTRSSPSSEQIPWSPERVAQELEAGRGVFVDFTADWCLSCKVNEKTVLKTSDIQELFKKNDIAFLIGDWTRYDQSITDALREHGRSGVPLYLYYPPGESQPMILPEILTKQIVINAIDGK